MSGTVEARDVGVRDLPRLELPTRPGSRAGGGPVDHAGGTLPDAAVAGIGPFAERLGVTPEAVYLAALWALLFRYTGQESVPVGRPAGPADPALGDLRGEPGFAALVVRAEAALRDGPAGVPGGAADPQVWLAFAGDRQPGPARPPGDAWEQCWTVADTGQVGVDYAAGRYETATVAAMVIHYGRLLAAGLAAPDTPVSRLDMLTAEERHELIHRWQGPPRLVRELTLAEAFAQRVAEDPAAVAVVSAGRPTSYGALNATANRIAAVLRELRAGPGERVAFCLPRGAVQVAAVLGILKAGAAFVPLDPAHPVSRRQALVRDATPAVILTDAANRATLSETDAVVIDLDSVSLDAYPDADVAGPARPADPAYVLYTSGSTGTPKGALIPHRAVVNFADRVGELFGIDRDDRVLGYAACGYDVSVFETFGALLHGAQLHVALDEERLNIRRLQRLIEDGGITIADLPPSVMALLEPERFPDLRVAFVGGEPFPGELVNRWNKGRRFINGYGVTEATVTQIVQECAGDHDTSPPIGLPMANHVAYVLDEHLRPVPYDVPGELVIGGAGLASGYWNRPELTARAFIANHLDPAAAPRLYRTGDRVKRLRDGRLVFLGRIDRQIKIHGVRIEPGEIEAVLLRHPAVRQALVDCRVDPRGVARLVGYVCPAAGKEVRAAELGPYLAAHLPPALVPRYLVPLGELPLNASGKVDRGRLPTPGPEHTVAEGGGSR